MRHECCVLLAAAAAAERTVNTANGCTLLGVGGQASTGGSVMVATATSGSARASSWSPAADDCLTATTEKTMNEVLMRYRGLRETLIAKHTNNREQRGRAGDLATARLGRAGLSDASRALTPSPGASGGGRP